MEKLINAIKNEDRHEITLALDAYVQFGEHTADNLLNILHFLSVIVERFQEIFSFQHGNETLTSYQYESVIWKFGEAIRQILKVERKLRRNEELFRRIEEICFDQSFGRGRESFTMLLGQYGGKEVIQTLIKLLSDKDVYGHAIYSLRLLKATEAQELVRPFLNAERTWIRNEVKKYFKKIQKV